MFINFLKSYQKLFKYKQPLNFRGVSALETYSKKIKNEKTRFFVSFKSY